MSDSVVEAVAGATGAVVATILTYPISTVSLITNTLLSTPPLALHLPIRPQRAQQVNSTFQQICGYPSSSTTLMIDLLEFEVLVDCCPWVGETL